MKTTHKLAAIVAICIIIALAAGCSGATGNVSAADPTERGLSYVAAAIVTSALIRAVCNK